MDAQVHELLLVKGTFYYRMKDINPINYVSICKKINYQRIRIFESMLLQRFVDSIFEK